MSYLFSADSARVELFPRPREEGSDYINASYLAVGINLLIMIE